MSRSRWVRVDRWVGLTNGLKEKGKGGGRIEKGKMVAVCLIDDDVVVVVVVVVVRPQIYSLVGTCTHT